MERLEWKSKERICFRLFRGCLDKPPFYYKVVATAGISDFTMRSMCSALLPFCQEDLLNSEVL